MPHSLLEGRRKP